MMTKKLLITVSLVQFLVFQYQVFGQDDCVPKSVQNIEILSNTTLVWKLDASEACDVTNFIIDIVGEKKYNYNITNSFLDVSFLGICGIWNFTIIPISSEVSGSAATLETYVPLPTDADLSLGFVSYSQPEGNLVMEWDLKNRTLGDCSVRYRLTINDTARNTTQEMYLKDTFFTFNDTFPCTIYSIVLRAVNMAHPRIEGRSSTTMKYRPGDQGPGLQIPPTLKVINAQTTSFNLTVGLDGYNNVCPLKALFVDGGSYFNKTVSLLGLEAIESANVQIDSLLPNKMYYFNVSIQNSKGWSMPGQFAVQTLDLTSCD
ncbi:hypothetical protein NQ315_001420 [Exocentrus adspersus]|uniref:Fibronectin type-III domain-containing protein n=1 Tax=Exocentrus adspersus TaxID=1586481 RepID=A0AAV8WFC9_9CUCU|nr:hypothetical protein NQ315_001420 [Exocentrus adspersus]